MSGDTVPLGELALDVTSHFDLGMRLSPFGVTQSLIRLRTAWQGLAQC